MDTLGNILVTVMFLLRTSTVWYQSNENDAPRQSTQL